MKPRRPVPHRRKGAIGRLAFAFTAAIAACMVAVAFGCTAVPSADEPAEAAASVLGAGMEGSASGTDDSPSQSASGGFAADGQEDESDREANMAESSISIEASGTTMKAALADNSSAEAFLELLAQGPITVRMNDYARMEKVGALGATLPSHDERITTSPGDIILYQGDQITIYYDTNTWSFTRLGKIEGVSADELRAVLGEGDVTVTFSLPQA